MKRTIAIIGGGLAGIAAAIRLDHDQFKPVLIESKKRLGGRASSVVDPRTGQVIDNCQHVLLGCCTNLIDLYDRLGVLDQIEWHRTLYWTRGQGEIDVMEAGWPPAPFHFTSSFQRMRCFTRSDKRHIARAMWRMIRMGSRARLSWRSRTFGEFLREQHQPEQLIADFWNTIIVSACNMHVDRVGAAYGLHVFQDGFLASKWSYSMGLATVPLGDLYASAIDTIIDNGGDVQLGVSAKAVAFDGRRVTGVVTEHGFVECSEVIAAVPFDRLDKLVSESMRQADKRLQSLEKFEVSPILGVHLHFDQPVMEKPHLVLVNPPQGVQWLFNKGMTAGGGGGQHVHAVISAADDWMELDEEEIVRRVMIDVHHNVPRSAGLLPVSARAIKEKRATFAATPEVEAIRPSTASEFSGGSGIENLLIAGDWTDTGWPATMEGAARSGYAAAAAVMNATDSSIFSVEDVPAGMIARLLGMR